MNKINDATLTALVGFQLHCLKSENVQTSNGQVLLLGNQLKKMNVQNSDILNPDVFLNIKGAIDWSENSSKGEPLTRALIASLFLDGDYRVNWHNDPRRLAVNVMDKATAEIINSHQKTASHLPETYCVPSDRNNITAEMVQSLLNGFSFYSDDRTCLVNNIVNARADYFGRPQDLTLKDAFQTYSDSKLTVSSIAGCIRLLDVITAIKTSEDNEIKLFADLQDLATSAQDHVLQGISTYYLPMMSIRKANGISEDTSPLDLSPESFRMSGPTIATEFNEVLTYLPEFDGYDHMAHFINKSDEKQDAYFTLSPSMDYYTDGLTLNELSAGVMHQPLLFPVAANPTLEINNYSEFVKDFPRMAHLVTDH